VCICYFLGFIQIRTIKHSEGSWGWFWCSYWV
jgi:hypothetical protein